MGSEEQEIQEDAEQLEELLALGRIGHAMSSYAILASLEMNRWQKNYEKIPEHHRELLGEGTVYACGESVVEAVHHNDMFLRYILEWMHECDAPSPMGSCMRAIEMWNDKEPDKQATVPFADFEKVTYVLKNVARDWTAEFEDERRESYGRVCDRLLNAFGDDRKDNKKVLVPGCGLARLCMEIVAKGFHVDGNEHSYFMLLTSAYILNGLRRKDQWTIFPWALNTSNVRSFKDQVQPVVVPDVVPEDFIASNEAGSMGMIAGDFSGVFSSSEFQDEYDAVVTCFFLDTAHNVIEYMECIWGVLRPGGVWINLGPAQWHWADSHTYLPEDEVSIEIPVDQVVEIAKQIGFEFENDVETVSCHYMSNPKTMRPQTYECALWTARKPKSII